VLTIRPLRLWDFAFCWRLANDPSAWKHYANPQPPTWWGHLRWMAAWLCKQDRMAWIVESRDVCSYGAACRPVSAGLVRVERRGTRSMMSVAVLPEHRRQGIAQRAITIASRWAIGHGWGTPTAYIHAPNTSSILAFRAAGFEMVGDLCGDGWVTMELRA
jgi:GNAT superfamily N-acetyltransferase